VKDKYIFIADTHLGSPTFAQSVQREKNLVSLLLSKESQTKAVYLLGDIFDFWWEYKSVVPKYFTRLLGTLALMSDRKTEIHFFIGNHDQWIGDYFEKEIGAIIHRQPLTCQIEGKSFFLAHGDGFDANDKKYMFLKAVFANKFLQGLFSAIHPRFGMAVAHLWSNYSRSKHIGQEGTNKGFDEPIIKYFQANTEPIDYYIIGHYHFDQVFSLSQSRELIILGAWFLGVSYAEFDGSKVELLHN
jgi:Uncharacterized protein conserved in bacteria